MDTILKRLRDSKGESTYQVAEAITKSPADVKCSQAHYFRVESGESDASPELAQALAKHFEVSLDTIFNPSRYAVADAEEAA